MQTKTRIGCLRGGRVGCLVGILLIGCQAPIKAATAGSTVLLDFKDIAQFTQFRVSEQTTIEPALEVHDGQRAAKIVFAPVPEGQRDYPAVVIEGKALKVRDFSPFEALSLWVKNPGTEEAELSLSVWDKDNHRSFPSPSTLTIKPGKWEQVVSRLVLHGLDAAQIGSVHFYQNSNRRPVTLLLADIQLLSPSAGRLAGQLQAARQALNTARASAVALGAKDQVEPQIAKLAKGLNALEAAASTSTERMLELAQLATEALDLAKAITIQNAGKKVILSGPLVKAAWLNDPEKLKLITDFTLSNSTLDDEIFTALAPAKNLDVVILDSKKITGAGLGKLTSDKLRVLGLSFTGATDDSLKEVGKFPTLQAIQLEGTNVTSGVFQNFDGLKQLRMLSLASTQISDTGFAGIAKLASLESRNLKQTRIHGESLRQLANLTRLKALDLSDTQLDDSDLSQLGKPANLESLSLENTPITGAGFGKFNGLDKLAVLNLNRTRVGDAALRQLGKLPKLVRLELSSTRVSDGGLSQILETAPQLQYLDLFGTSITDGSLALLKNKQGLVNLFLGGTQTTDAGLSNLEKLPTLQHLDVEGTQITDAGLQYLQGKKLFDVRLGKTRISGAGLKNLANTRGLLFLDLSGTSVTDESLVAFAKLDHLLTLNLSGSRVTSKGMSQLKGCGQLRELRLEATAVGDEGLELLGALQNLQRLNLNESAVTNVGLKHLKKLLKLTDLSLSRTRITDDGVPDLSDKLVELDLSHTRLTNKGIEQLQRCGRLSTLRLAATDITNNALKGLQAMPGLTRLDLSETAIDDQGLQDLVLLPQLHELNLNGTPISDRGIDALLKLASLQRVSLEGARVSVQGVSYLRHSAPKLTVDLVFPFVWGERWTYFPASATPDSKPQTSPTAFLQQLKDMSSLRYLHVDDSLLTPEALRSLKDLPRLEHLSFQNTAITDDLLAELLGLSQVARLEFADTRITDRGLAHLKEMQALRELNLEGTQVTGAGFVHLANLTRLQALNLRNTALDDFGVAHLADLKELRKLELSGTHVTDAGLEHLTQLARLQYLDLAGTGVTDHGLMNLSRQTGLRYLYLTNTQVTDGGIVQLGQLTELDELGLDGTQLSDDGLARLSALTNLSRLRIGHTKVTEAGLAYIALLPHIDRLELAGLPVTNAGLERIQRMSRLKLLDLSGTQIDDGALAALAKLPLLTELNVRDTRLMPDALANFRKAHPAVSVIAGTTPTGYSLWAKIIAILYLIAVCAICIYGFHRYWHVWCLFKDKRTRTSPVPASLFSQLPRLTVQLPMFNEHHVAERIIEAVCALDYPRELLQIQVLDDSNDDSADIARNCCARMTAAGHPVEYLHRSQREGFKSGALAAGLKTASGEFIVIFDADFIPAPDFLRQTIHYFNDPKIGVVQAEWAHLNRADSWLTELQAMFLDGHFVVEQAVRSRCGRWFNFNGTAGVWRRSSIDEAGGWQHDTLTEDTDLSYRAQLKGWKFLYLPTVRCNAELPATMSAFVGQQHRWTKGLIQSAKKLLPRILFSKVPWKIKLEAWFHLTTPIMYLVMFLVTAIALPAIFLATPFTDQPNLALTVALGTLVLGTFGAASFYIASQRVQGLPLGRAILKIPFLMALGVGIGAVNARAVVEALLGFRSPFVRTPKFGARGDFDPDQKAARRRLRFPAGLMELLMAGVLYACLVLSFMRPFTLIGAPFLLLTGEFQAFVKDRQGYNEYGSMNIVESHDVQRHAVVAVIPNTLCPAMGYEDKEFDPKTGISEFGFKISAQSDRVSGAGYRPFRGTIRISGARITDIDPAAHPEPEILRAAHVSKRPVLTPSEFLAASGVDRPWPLGYAFSGPVAPAHTQELERTYSAIEKLGCRFTRVYVGDYRTGVVFDSTGKAAGVEPEFLNYLDQLATVANRHGITVMFSLTDNAMLNRGRAESIALVREGEASEAFVNHVLAEFVKKLQGRQVIWDIFNEPENAITVPLREIQRYVDRVVLAGRRADPHARFTVVSRSKPEIVYWQGRDLDLYSHNIFTDQALKDALVESTFDAPITVAEMAPELATQKNLDALRDAGYAGIGIWGWGTRDKYEWREADLDKIMQPLVRNRDASAQTSEVRDQKPEFDVQTQTVR